MKYKKEGFIMINNDKLVIGGHEFHSRFILGSGKYSMKLGGDAQAIRSVPYLQDGVMSMDLYVPANANFTMQLQSGHNREYNHAEATPIAFRVENGKLYLRDETTALAEIKEGWNTITFDLKLTQFKAALSINGGKAIDIPPKELELLYFLASNCNRVFTRDQLLDKVWGFDYLGDSRTVDVHVKRLREKLEGVSDKWILKTVWGVGYKFDTKM